MSIISRLGNKLKFEFTARIVAVLSGGILTVALARLLRPSEYGLLFLTLAILNISITFSRLGIGKSTSRYISEYREMDPGQIPYILRFGFLFTLLMISIVCVILLVVHKTIADLVSEPNLNRFLLFGTAFIAFSTLVSFVRFSLQGFEDIKGSSIIFLIDRGGRTVFALGLVLIGLGATGALAGYIIASVISSIIGIIYIYKSHYFESIQERIEPQLRKRITEYSFPLVVSSAARSIDNRIDIFLVGFFINPTAVAYYTISKQLIDFIQVPISSLTFTFSPAIKSEMTKGNLDSAANMYEEALSYTLLLYVPAAAGLIILSEPIIRVFFGKQYLEAVPVLQALSVYAVLLSISVLTGNSLDFIGRARERAIIKGITSVANAVLNVLLLPRMGVFGAAIATVITHSIFTVSTIYYMSLEIQVRKLWLFRYSTAVVAITTVMSIVVYLLSKYISNMISLIAIVGVGVITWTFLSVTAGLVDVDEVSQIVQ
ncbi:polysaccharide biosynthesis protein [Haladaptatus paucihalophilus DX253]|uniref:Membrane protein involved in the export of O-antigen and teichoic acid n=1 Tax=Haladaptatus paucihalophilus DX253 TaxID=797209 RepID=E7QZJ9_HALPU|nr:flippase [Haladaptatus paucihalophilus]EFW90120.1 polysaccharide biosynthesis protein [Haladaptatus paucihalophilus DX253]SHL06128.1 Membrane protein involved in the export of O-antigen and teichoic acid [Haladaptatus paucihalophilus DX253]